MRNILYILFSMSVVCSCAEFDATSIWDEINDHEDRIADLEQVCERLNGDIAAQKGIVAALQTNDYVTGVSDILEDGKVVGYTISFHKGEPVSIYHGADGTDGSNGSQGSDGSDGAPGADGRVPVIGINKDADGVYCWMLDGEWILDDEGRRIPANGNDGKDGADGSNGPNGADGADGADGSPGTAGTDGKDGVTPKLKVEDGFWCVSYDNGVSWEQLYKATAEDGKDGDSFFLNVDCSDDDFVVLMLVNGQQVKLPTWKAFQDLKAVVNRLNTNRSALQKIVTSLQDHDYVTDVRPLQENGEEVGYTIYFAKNLPVTIYHGEDGTDGADGADGAPGKDGVDGEDGKDGVDGAPGKDGEDGSNGAPGKDGADGEDGADGAPGKDGVDGEDGADGKDGHSPVIGIRKEADGNYYWTVNGEWMLDAPDKQFPSGGDSYWILDGEWLLDENGNKVPATGRDGKDGITPKLKIEGGYWYVSYDCGRTWGTEPLGPAAGQPSQSIFADITYDEDYVCLVMDNGEVIKLPRHGSDEVPFDSDLVGVTYHSVKFVGSAEVPADDAPFTRVVVYYSDSEEFNVHTAQSASVQSFEYNGNFALTVDGLKSGCRYSYCFCLEVNDEEFFGPVMVFTTKAKVPVVLDMSKYEPQTGLATVNGANIQWSTSTSYYHYQISLEDLGNPEWFEITANEKQGAYVALFYEKATSAHNGLYPPFAMGWKDRLIISKGKTMSFDVPFNAKYLYVYCLSSSGTDYTPALIEYDGLN